MDKPIISFSCSAIRDFRYRECYDSLANGTTVLFEVVFVGPKPPKARMPDNFRYIETNVKPAQCYEIAVRESKGDYVQIIADDEDFSEDYINKLYNYTKLLDMDKILITVGLRLWPKPNECQMIDKGCVFDPWAFNAPFVGFAPLFRRDIWNEIGGIDRRFRGSMTDVDVQMRFYEYGFVPFMTPDCFAEERLYYENGIKTDSLLTRTGNIECKLLSSFWTKKDGLISNKRLEPVQSFSDKDILVKDQ